jgi:hypothetical protein
MQAEFNADRHRFLSAAAMTIAGARLSAVALPIFGADRKA